MKTADWIFEGANPITKKRDHRMDFLACVGGLRHGYNRLPLCPQNMTKRVCLAKIKAGASPPRTRSRQPEELITMRITRGAGSLANTDRRGRPATGRIDP